MILLYTLEITGIIIFIVLAALLLIPFNYYFVGRKYDTACVKLGGSWMFGLVKFLYKKSFDAKGKFIIQFAGIEFKLKTKKNPAQKDKLKDKLNKKKSNTLSFFNKKFLKHITKALLELFNHIKPKKFFLEGRFGFEDPYYTGITLALLNILSPKLQEYRINARPVFDEEVLEGKMFIGGRLILIKVVFIALKLYLDKNVRNVLKSRKENVYVT